jgi:hypothetical protein
LKQSTKAVTCAFAWKLLQTISISFIEWISTWIKAGFPTSSGSARRSSGIIACLAGRAMAPNPRSALACVFALGLLGTVLRDEVWAADRASPGVCMQKGRKLAGALPALIGKSIRQPRKVRNVAPKHPELPTGTVGSGSWMGEVLVNARGQVVEVWTIREADLKPAFPAFNHAIIEAIRGWEFAPLVVNGRPTPWCTTVAHTINWS